MSGPVSGLWSRLPLRARLTALYTGLFTVATAIVLVLTYELMGRHLHRTLPSPLADPVLDRFAVQLVLVLIGTTLVAAALGWLAARRALRPIHRVTAAARRVSDERLDERLNLQGPDDEVRELADTFDAMLDRLSGSLDAQRRFVANASHELRTPLTAIRTEVDVTLDDPDADRDELRQMGERVLAGADDLNDLLDGLLMLARSQRGLGRRTPVDLAHALRRGVADVGERDGIELTIDAGRPAIVSGDDALLRRTAANLIDNARRYNRPGGWIRARTDVVSHDGRPWATLRVVNSGPVVPQGDVQRIVEPFERLGRHGTGSGLGLSIVAAVAEAHGGRMWIVAPESGGLDVTVELPVAA